MLSPSQSTEPTPTPQSTSNSKSTLSSRPIDALDDDLAKIYTHVHPVLLLAVFYWQFPALVSDPITALYRTVLPLGVLQLIYVCVCLPSSNHAITSKGQRKKGVKHESIGISWKVVPAILSLILALTCATPVLAIVLILFGAPFTTHQFHTMLSAAHISLLSAFPLFYVHGVDAARWREVLALSAPIDGVFGAAFGTMLGAWAGAVPIPLDWDREWQKWPVTIVTGAYIGFVVGKLAGGYLLRGKKILIA